MLTTRSKLLVAAVLLFASLASGQKINLATQVQGRLSTPNGGVPSGGTAGQALQKNSNTSYDYGWATITIPAPTLSSLGGVNSKDCSSLGASYVVQKINLDGSITCVLVSTGGSTWGLIGGTLTDQSDLTTALGLKANTSSLATVATSGSATDLSTGTLNALRLPASINSNTTGNAATASLAVAVPANGVSAGALGAGVSLPWTQVTGQPTIPSGSTFNPYMNGVAAPGNSGNYSKADHVHPSDTSREPALGNPSADGYVLASTAVGVRSWVPQGGGGMLYPLAGIGCSTGSAWCTSYGTGNVIPANFLATIPYTQLSGTPAIPLAGTTTPLMDGTGAAGNGTTWAPINHVHPTDTTRLAVANNLSDLTSAPTARTNLGLAAVASSGSYNDLSNQPTIPALGSTTPNMDGTGSAGSAATSARSDHTHPSDTSREPALGNPSSSGYVLASTITGTRSWVPQGGGASLSVNNNSVSTPNLSNGGSSQFYVSGSNVFNRRSGNAPGLVAWGDSITAGTTPTSSCLAAGGYTCYAYLLSFKLGGPLASLALTASSGDMAADTSIKVVTSSVVMTSGNSTNTLMVGVNEANSYANNAAQKNIYSQAHSAIIGWLTTPDILKVGMQQTGSTGNGNYAVVPTLAGTWTVFGSYKAGWGEQSTVQNSTITWTDTVSCLPGATNGAYYYFYSIKDGDAGTQTFSIDAVASTDTITGAASLQTAGGGVGNTGTISTLNGATQTIAMARFVATCGSHSFKVTNTGATGTTFAYAAGSTYINSEADAPRVIVGGVLRQLADANSAATAAYNTVAFNDVATLRADGAYTDFADVRAYVNSVSSGTIGGDMYNALHPDVSTIYPCITACGHQHLVEAFNSVLRTANYSAGLYQLTFRGPTTLANATPDTAITWNAAGAINIGTFGGTAAQGNHLGTLNAASVVVYNGGSAAVTIGTAGIKIGTSGNTIGNVFSGTGTLTYTSIPANSCQAQTMTVTGVSTASTFGIFCSPRSATFFSTTFGYGGAYGSASNTVGINVCNLTTGALTPTAVTWACTAFQ